MMSPVKPTQTKIHPRDANNRVSQPGGRGLAQNEPSLLSHFKVGHRTAIVFDVCGVAHCHIGEIQSVNSAGVTITLINDSTGSYSGPDEFIAALRIRTAIVSSDEDGDFDKLALQYQAFWNSVVTAKERFER